MLSLEVPLVGSIHAQSLLQAVHRLKPASTQECTWGIYDLWVGSLAALATVDLPVSSTSCSYSSESISYCNQVYWKTFVDI